MRVKHFIEKLQKLAEEDPSVLDLRIVMTFDNYGGSQREDELQDIILTKVSYDKKRGIYVWNKYMKDTHLSVITIPHHEDGSIPNHIYE